MYTIRGGGADLPFFLRFGLQYSQAQSYDICTRIIYLTQSHYMWSITQRAASTISASGGLEP